MDQENSPYENRNKKFTIEGQYLEDLSFENPSMPHILFMEPTKIDNDIFVEVGVNHANQEENGAFQVLLKLKIKTFIKLDETNQGSQGSQGNQAEQKNNEMVVFMLDLTYVMLVLLDEAVLTNNDESEIQRLLTVDCPYIMFPYVRNLVSLVSMESGVTPLILGQIDFLGMLEKNQEKLKAQIA